jgi:predicted outer membrane repeat protein
VYTNASASTSMVAVDTVASWAQLVTACVAPSASITLSPAFKMRAYTNEIDFSGKVIIIFGSNATFDAGQKGRFFSGDASKGKTSLELHGITLKNGNAADYPGFGAAISISGGTLVIHDSIFDTNTAGDWPSTGGYNRGGAIYAYDGAHVVIYVSRFERNSAGDGGFGGAIFVDGSLAAFNCTFHGNTAPAGGAVCVWNGAIATFTGCIFNGNDDGTTGHNDITRRDDTSNVTFACANGTVGAPVTMKAGESEIAKLLNNNWLGESGAIFLRMSN